jgi:large conductance mechanosensitive channel
MAGMLEEFREFALRGNAVDLAVGLIIGSAFGAMVTSLVNDVFMPPLGKLLGGADFSDFFLVVGAGSYPTLAAAREAGAVTLNYGLFLKSVVNLIIVALALFILVRGMNRLRRAQPPPAPPASRDCPYCATAIPLKATRCPHCTSAL